MERACNPGGTQERDLYVGNSATRMSVDTVAVAMMVVRLVLLEADVVMGQAGWASHPVLVRIGVCSSSIPYH